MKIPEFVKTLTKPCLAFFFHFFFSAAATIKAQLKGLLTTFAAEDTWPVLWAWTETSCSSWEQMEKSSETNRIDAVCDKSLRGKGLSKAKITNLRWMVAMVGGVGGE